MRRSLIRHELTLESCTRCKLKLCQTINENKTCISQLTKSVLHSVSTQICILTVCSFSHNQSVFSWASLRKPSLSIAHNQSAAERRFIVETIVIILFHECCCWVNKFGLFNCIGSLKEAWAEDDDQVLYSVPQKVLFGGNNTINQCIFIYIFALHGEVQLVILSMVNFLHSK